MNNLTEQLTLYTAWEPPGEPELRERIAAIETLLERERSKNQDKFASLELDYACRVFEEQTALKFQALKATGKQAASDIGVLQLLQQITTIVGEENTKAEAILGNIRHSTDVLRTVGISHDQISQSAAVGKTLVGDIKQHEAKDKLIIGGLFGIFVLVSIIIVVKRLWKLLKPIIFVAKTVGKTISQTASSLGKLSTGAHNKPEISKNLTDIQNISYENIL